jgi:hypothetical protein
MQWILAGICFYDTINPDSHAKRKWSGNVPGSTINAFPVDLDPGKHVLAVRVMGGRQGWLLCTAVDKPSAMPKPTRCRSSETTRWRRSAKSGTLSPEQ